MAGANNIGHSGAVYAVLSTPIDNVAEESPDFDKCTGDESNELSAFFSLRSFGKKMEKKNYGMFRNRNLIVDLLAICFGIGTWLAVNGTFIQLPLLVNEAPEGWSLPSYLSVMVQIGNLGPLLYTLFQKYSAWKLDDGWTIHVVLAIGTLSCLLTAFFYNRTAIAFGNDHSVALFILTIFTAVNACTSSVLFMPYMGRFKEQYMITYFIGEGLSGLLPSVTALVQGIGDTGTCVLVNVTESGEAIYDHQKKPPLFDTKVFFLILFGLMVLSYIGYTLLNALPVAKREYAQVTVSKGNKYEYGQEDNGPTVNKLSRAQYAALLILIGLISLFSNGIFGSIQSFSSAPYGMRAYHLSATLSVIANPLACFMAMFLHFTSLRVIYVLSTLAALLTSYVFTTAVLSPYPPLYDQTIGVVMVVAAWTLLVGIVSYTKLGITTVMRAQGGKSLVWVGAITQLGSAIGAISIFFAINYTRFFEAAPPPSC